MCGRVAKMLRKYASKTYPRAWKGGKYCRVVYRMFNDKQLTIEQVKMALGK